MRLISQDGCLDIPYEQTALARRGTEIYADFDEVMVAKYTTKKKAKKVMEMCRERYSKARYNESAMPELAGTIASLPKFTSIHLKAEICDMFIFKFPEDSEVQE